jgi:hypothetical protein
VVADLAEVLLAEAKQSSAAELGVPAYVVVRVWVQLVAALVVPDLFGVILRLEVDRARGPVSFLTRNIAAEFKHQDAFGGGGQLVGERPTAGAGADDDHVELSG